MSKILGHLEPQAVFHYFEEIAAIPHGSRNTKKIADYCEQFAKDRGLQHTRDASDNVIIVKPAAKGYETAAPVVLQGHLDMVCEKAPGCTKDMETEGLDLVNSATRLDLLENKVTLAVPEGNPKGIESFDQLAELLASGEARSISAATRAVELSRSAFYKYKDCIFDSENGREVITVMATLRDETGALQSLLAGISAAGASIVTINQSTPENGAALVAVTIRTDTMQMSPEELTEKLSRQRMVVSVRCGYNL